MAERNDVPDGLVAAAQRYDLKHHEGDWQPVPDDQVRRLLAGARQMIMRIVSDSMGRELRVVPVADLRVVVDLAARYLDMCEPPLVEESASLAYLRAAAGEPGA